MKALGFVLSTALFSVTFAATMEHFNPFTGLAQAEETQAEETSSPNGLDVQDRLRDRERDRAHDDVRARLGDRSPEPHRDQGFTAPSTDYKPNVPDASPEPRQNR